MRIEVEVLEHHPDVLPDAIDVPLVVGQLDAVDDDPALLMFLQAVDAADHCRFS